MPTAQQLHDIRNLPNCFHQIVSYGASHYNSTHISKDNITNEQIELLKSLGYLVVVFEDTNKVLVRWPC